MPVRTQSDVSDIGPYMWVKRLPFLRGTGRVIDSAILALASAGLGRNNSDQEMLQNAVSAYGTTMRYLQQDLNDPRKLSGHQVLAASNAM